MSENQLTPPNRDYVCEDCGKEFEYSLTLQVHQIQYQHERGTKSE